jgi:hypothetical protein
MPIFVLTHHTEMYIWIFFLEFFDILEKKNKKIT